MTVGNPVFPEIHVISGIRLGTAFAGIKKDGRDDLLVIEMAEGTRCSAVFTRNKFCAAPVIVARRHILQSPRWLIVNSGNANAGTGNMGLEDAYKACRGLADLVDAQETEVLPFSTGVIGEALPVTCINDALPKALSALAEDAWKSAAAAIMTTDTHPKGISREIRTGPHRIVITGICKGAGMIHPDMATMLAFIGTDARLNFGVLQSCLHDAVDKSFNCISVDGDTSTNDACVLMATGQSSAPELAPGSTELEQFVGALQDVCDQLAELIVRDGEGASKLMRVIVDLAASEAEARIVAKTIAQSPLVKTALFAGDPNWGRILAAVGRADIDELDISKVSIHLGDVNVIHNGEPNPDYSEVAGQKVMAQDTVTVRVSLGRGQASQRVLGCDLSYEYVRINAEYRT